MRDSILTALILLSVVTAGNAQAVRSFTVTKDSVLGNVPNAGVWFVTENSGSTWITGDSALVAKADTSNLSVWTVMNNGIPASAFIYCLEFVSSSTIYAGGSEGAIYKTTNGGTSWNLVYQNLSETNFIDLITFFDQNNGMAWGDPITSSGVDACLQTTDGGTTWTNNNSVITKIPNGVNVRFVPPSNVFLCGTVGTAGKEIDGIWRSTDRGKTWAFGTVGTSSMDSVTFSHTNAFASNLVGVVCRIDSTFWSTSDGGVSWQQIGAKAMTRYFDVTFVPGTNIAIAGGAKLAAVCKVDLDSRTFTEFQDVTRAGVSFNHVDFPDLRHGYMSNGLNRRFYSVDFSGTSEVPADTRMPSAITLAQNYPNPFNPSTIIRYTLPHRLRVILTVFTVLGQKVAELVNGDVDPGNHEARFDARNLASGVYFYRIQTGDFIQTRKLLLLK